LSTETVLQASTWTIGILLSAAAAWFATCWVRRSPTTYFARILFTALLTFVASPWLHELAMRPFSWAIWRCSVCDASEYQVRFHDRPVYRAQRYPSFSKQVSAITAEIPHEHDWLFWKYIIAYGDRAFACTVMLGDEGDVYFSCLAKIPSPEIARGMVAKVAGASLEQRQAMIDLFESRNVGEPFVSLHHGAEPTREQFEQAYVAWLDRHPEWK
jgi:hypothetical protein